MNGVVANGQIFAVVSYSKIAPEMILNNTIGSFGFTKID